MSPTVEQVSVLTIDTEATAPGRVFGLETFDSTGWKHTSNCPSLIAAQSTSSSLSFPAAVAGRPLFCPYLLSCVSATHSHANPAARSPPSQSDQLSAHHSRADLSRNDLGQLAPQPLLEAPGGTLPNLGTSHGGPPHSRRLTPPTAAAPFPARIVCDLTHCLLGPPSPPATDPPEAN